MKKIFLFIFLFVGMSSYGADKLETLLGSDGLIPVEQKKDSVKKESALSLHFGAGVSFPLNLDADYSFVPMRSLEFMFGLSYDYTPKDRLQTYSVGIAGIWRNFGLHSGQYFGKTDDGYVDVASFPEGTKSRASRIHVYSFAIPLMFTQKFGHKSHYSFSFGPIVCFNSGSINSHYTIGDTDYNASTRHIGTRPVTVDIMGVFRAYGFGLYCKYSPMSVFKLDRGPKFQSLSFGLYF